MTNYIKGQKVNIQITAIVTEDADTLSLPGITLTSPPVVTQIDPHVAAPANPEHWPPQARDIWRVGDEEYYVRVSAGGNTVIESFDNPRADNTYWSGALLRTMDDFKARNPVLIRRNKSNVRKDTGQ